MSTNKLAVTVDGIDFRNPLIVGSGPPSATFGVLKRASAAGMGGAVLKTVSPDHEVIKYLTKPYGRFERDGQMVAHANIELIATGTVAQSVEIVRRIREHDPDFVLIVSMMAPAKKRQDWQDLVGVFAEAGAHGFELNGSCPHGLSEREMGAAIGSDTEAIQMVCEHVRSATALPVWFKVTPSHPAGPQVIAAFAGGASGVTTTNTMPCIIDFDLESMTPYPMVTGTGMSTPGGMSGPALAPIARQFTNEAAQIVDQGDQVVSGCGGVETGDDAAMLLALGAATVQICTELMRNPKREPGRGWERVPQILEGLEARLEQRGMASVSELIGAGRDTITTYARLLELQATYKATGKVHDGNWDEEHFGEEVDKLTN